MSNKGFHLQKVDKFFVYFKEGELRSLNYRIDVVKRDEKEAINIFTALWVKVIVIIILLTVMGADAIINI
ncbi:MAG: DUF2812 domain-containing protein [Tissierellia bacterium]|nr:DUF2812 domain-containing protein [Tissierellia bacterium]